jgi:hypothetical protein
LVVRSPGMSALGLGIAVRVPVAGVLRIQLRRACHDPDLPPA